MDLIEINPDNPQASRIEDIVKLLRKGGIKIYPTDTVYGMGCDITQPRAIEKICRIKGVKTEKANLSLICSDLSHLYDYCKQIDNSIFKVMKKALPGPFTFILKASSNVPRLISPKKKTVGIRIPDHNIPLEIVRALGNPIITTSIKDEDDVIEYTTDPTLIFEKYKKLVDVVIDGGYGKNEASTVLDCTSGEIEILRQGQGDIEQYL